MQHRSRISRPLSGAAVAMVVAVAAALSLTTLSPASAQPYTWQRQNVSLAAPGWYSSLVMDSTGRPHVAYRETKELIKYAWYDGTAWGGAGSTPTAPTPPDTVSTGVTTGDMLSLALDSLGTPHIAFAASGSPYRLSYASWDGTAWVLASPDVQTATHWVGAFPSLAIDGSGTPHLSYIDGTEGGEPRTARGKLMYAFGTVVGGAWSWTTTEVAPGTVATGNTSLALDSVGSPHIAYYDETNADVRYAGLGPGGWASESAADLDTGVIVYGLSLALHGDEPRIAYAEGGRLLYAKRDGGAWLLSELESTGVDGGFTGTLSLGVDANDFAHIAYRGPASGKTAIIHRWFDGTAWQSEVAGALDDGPPPPPCAIPPSELAAWYPSLALDGEGRPRVSYFVQTNCTPLNTESFGGGLTVYAHLNEPPGTDDFATVPENGTALIDVLANDARYGFSGALILEVESLPAHGAANIEDGRIRYQPGPNFNGEDELTYRVCDRNGTPELCGTATVKIHVEAVNHAPSVWKGGADGQEVQYSDPVAAMTVMATDVDSDVTSLVASAGLPAGLSLTLTSTTDKERVWTITGAANVPAGTYPIEVTVSDGTPDTTSVTFTLNVTKENAQILYSGKWLARLGSAPLPMRATVVDSAAAGYTGKNPEIGPGATMGDITKMKVAFDILGAKCAGPVLETVSASVGDGSTVGDGIGTAVASLTNPGGSTDVTYCVRARISGDYYAGDDAQTAEVRFYNESGQFVTGGGWIVDPSEAKGYFRFNGRYTTQGAPKGQLVYHYRGSYGGARAAFVIEGNAITQLAFGGTTYPTGATLQGKASIRVTRASDGVRLFSDRHATFIAKVVDSGRSSSGGSDSFALTVYGKNGMPYKAVPTTTLSGGNVVVHGKKHCPH